MRNLTSFRITALGSFVFLLSSGSCNLCKSQSASLPVGQAGYEVAGRSTLLLDNPGQISIASPYTAKPKSDPAIQKIKSLR